MKKLPVAITKELYLITGALGFLSVYAQENNKEVGHPIYKLIDNLSKIVRLYKSRYNFIIMDCFNIFDSITKEEQITIDVIAFANALLQYHQIIKKHFHPNSKAVKNFYINYKKQNSDYKTFGKSRALAKAFYNKL